MELVGREPATNHGPVPFAAGEANTQRERVSEVVDAPSMSRALELGVAMRTELETFEAGPPGCKPLTGCVDDRTAAHARPLCGQ